MRQFALLLGVAILAVSYTACTNNSPYVLQETKVGDSHHILTMDAAKRSIVVVGIQPLTDEEVDFKYSFFGTSGYNRKSAQKLSPNVNPGFCAEPAPDAMGTLATSYAAKLSAEAEGIQGSLAKGKGSGELNSNSLSGVFELFQRSQGVQVLRDGLFRLCEAFLNGAISKAEYKEHLINVITTLNFVVPVEICSKISDVDTEEEFREFTLPTGGQTDNKDSKKEQQVLVPFKVKVKRNTSSELMKNCFAESLKFADKANEYSKYILNATLEGRQILYKNLKDIPSLKSDQPEQPDSQTK